MAIEMQRRHTRRGLLTMIGAAVAGAAATSVAGVQRVFGAASDGAVVHVGDHLTDVSATTLLKNVSSVNTVLYLNSVSPGTGTPLVAIADTAIGVWAESTTTGLLGMGHGGTAVLGSSSTSIDPPAPRPDTGVYGYSDHNDGVGVAGIAASSTGNTTGVFGRANSSAGMGVHGFSNEGRGGVFKGGAAPLKLAPSTKATHPISGQRGDLFVDNTGRLWFCQKGGNPATWKQVSLV